MKHIYKVCAIALFGIMLISAQGVEAQPHKNKSKNESFSSDRDRGRSLVDSHRSRKEYGRDKSYGRHYGSAGSHGHHKSRVTTSYGHYGYGHVKQRQAHRSMQMFNGRLYSFQEGQFHVASHGRWIQTSAPIGLRVMKLPYGAQLCRTQFGDVYSHRGIFYEEARRGIGFVVTNAPARDRRGW